MNNDQPDLPPPPANDPQPTVQTREHKPTKSAKDAVLLALFPDWVNRRNAKWHAQMSRKLGINGLILPVVGVPFFIAAFGPGGCNFIWLFWIPPISAVVRGRKSLKLMSESGNYEEQEAAKSGVALGWTTMVLLAIATPALLNYVSY